MEKVSDQDLSDVLCDVYNRFLGLEGETEFGENLIAAMREATFNLNGALMVHMDKPDGENG